MGTTLIQFTRSYMHGRTTTTRVYCSWLFNTGVILLIFGLIVTVLPFLAGYHDEYRSLDLSGLFYLGLMIIIVSFGFLLCFHITNIVVIDDDDIESDDEYFENKEHSKKRCSWIHTRDIDFRPEDFKKTSTLPNVFGTRGRKSRKRTQHYSLSSCDDLEIPSAIRAFDGDACNLTRIRKMESISNRRINRLNSSASADDEGCDNFVFSL